MRDIDYIDIYWRAANYISVMQLYLKSNTLLREELAPDHLKQTILGHWGTVPGQNFIYAHLSDWIRRNSIQLLLVTGPGHGAVSYISNLYLEGTLTDFYPQITQDANGLNVLANRFATQKGFHTEISPHLPGVIYEGGELGHALSVSAGAALDNPDLVVACIIGDGEAETGPTASSWFINRYLDPATSGTVLPILHLNGYKMASPSIYSSMSDEELMTHFASFGYQPLIVHASHTEMVEALNTCYQLMSERKKANNPMIVLRTPKGWTGIKTLNGEKIEGTARSHKAPIKDPAGHLHLLQEWLHSYRPEELFDAEGRVKAEVLTCLPCKELRIGRNKYAAGDKITANLELSTFKQFEVKDLRLKSIPPAILSEALINVMQLNRANNNFRIFSPDELESNGFEKILSETSRCFLGAVQEHDKQISPEGRIIEILNENICHGLLQGYLQTGRNGLLITYESFAPVMSSMVVQYMKFLSQSKGVAWREGVPSINFILTSLGWRNCYTHQNPDFLSTLLNPELPFVRIYTPTDANSLLVCMEKVLQSRGQVNAIVFSKTKIQTYLNYEQAQAQSVDGLSEWEWTGTCAFDDEPDIVLAVIGDYLTEEAVRAVQLFKAIVPELKIRFLSVLDMTVLRSCIDDPQAISDEKFIRYFTSTKPVLFNFIGYPSTLKAVLFARPNAGRFTVKGYIDRSGLIDPDSLLAENGVSCKEVVKNIYEIVVQNKPGLASYRKQLEKHLCI